MLWKRAFDQDLGLEWFDENVVHEVMEKQYADEIKEHKHRKQSVPCGVQALREII